MTESCLKRKTCVDKDDDILSPEVEHKKGKFDSEEKETKPTTAKTKFYKYAMPISYCGQGFFGMQINGDIPTIERELLTTLYKCNLIDDEDVRKPGGKLCFQRAARTDKNVSAVKQMCSLKLPRSQHDSLTNGSQLKSLNDALSDQIKIWGFVRVTNGFNAKLRCDNRTYSYTLPSFALAPSKDIISESYRLTDDHLKTVQSVLDKFKGTHNFFNFTSGRSQEDKSCIRYILSCQCGTPFTVNDMEFITITIRGQSFMLHQIRKIIGLTIAIVRGFVDETIVSKALSNKNKVDVPKAPGLGLVLKEVHFDWYNDKFESTHEKISWEKYEDELRKFRREFIDQSIFDAETKTKSMMEWLKVLDLHDYESTEKEDNISGDIS